MKKKVEECIRRGSKIYVTYQSLDSLPFVPVQLILIHSTNDGDIEFHKHLYALLDTGAQVTTISNELLPEPMKSLSIISGTIRFGGYHEPVDIVIEVRPSPECLMEPKF